MIRTLHRWPGVVLAALLFVAGLSGAALSLYPTLELVGTPRAEAALSVAELADRVQATHPGLEQIRRSPSGRITAWWFDRGQPGSAVIDPATGRDLASADPDPVRRWLTTLHRSLFLGDGGRMAAAAGALAMLVLSISGAVLVARRTGGWRRWFARLRGPLAGRLHTAISRATVVGLVLSSVTALWMSAETFEWVTVEPARLEVPARVAAGRDGPAPAAMPALRATPVAELRELSFPAPGDPEDVFTLRTDRGTGLVDPATGSLLAWQAPTFEERLSGIVRMLHTGEGAAVLGLILGLSALGVPALAATGLLTWWAGRRGRPRVAGNAPAGQAGTVVLVGSEGGSTWGFAATLAGALRAAGQSVHVAPMSGFAPSRYRRAERFLILAATYGEGDVPASARGFLDAIDALSAPPSAPVAVLGFGDRAFPAFCAFAAAVDQAARAKGWAILLPFDTIDRQSSQDFARWGRALGGSLGIGLELAHQPAPPATEALTLLERRDHGAAVQVPMAILRFALPRTSRLQRLTGRGFARFEPGDLLGVLPSGSPVPRLYSLASGSRDGFIEIVVRRHAEGLASGQLTSLRPGQTVQAFLRRNPRFHAPPGRAPLVLVGAGTGVGPLAGFVRCNTARRPIHLFFGLRHPGSDFLYRDEWPGWQAEGRLSGLSLAVSRGDAPRRYVQDALREDGLRVAQAVRAGGRIMVCGGRDMARGVDDALAGILAPLGLTPAMLREEGRYVEDVY